MSNTRNLFREELDVQKNPTSFGIVKDNRITISRNSKLY